MTVITMSRTEIDRMSVLQDLAASRIKVTEAATLMRLGRRQVFRLAKAYGKHGPQALVSRRRGPPSHPAHPPELRAIVPCNIPRRDPRLLPSIKPRETTQALHLSPVSRHVSAIVRPSPG